jgi:DNA-binding MarR family transcriptional regulator
VNPKENQRSGRDTTVESLAERLSDTLGGVHRTMRRRVRHSMPGEPLRGSQAELLRLVDLDPGIGVSRAARALHLADNSVSSLVNQLVSTGMLRRDTDPDDRRAARLFLTPVAQRRLRDWENRRARVMTTEIARLTPAERAVLNDAIPVLRRLATLIAASDASGA